MGVAEEEAGHLAADGFDERRELRVAHVERVEVGGPVEEVVPQPALEAVVAVLRVAPQLRHPLAEPPPAPLVGPDGAGRLPLHRRLVGVDRERHAGRAGGLLDAQLRDVERAGDERPPVPADVGLRQDRERFEVGERLHVLGVDAGLVPRGPVVGHRGVGVPQLRLERRQLPPADEFRRVVLRLPQLAQVPEVPAALPPRPERVHHVAVEEVEHPCSLGREEKRSHG